MSFADLEERTNAAVMRRLSNARALKVGAAEDFPIIFDRTFLEGQAGIGGTAPVATALDTDITGFVSNVTQITIRSVTYTLLDMHPDGAGFTVLVLEVA